MAPLAPPLATPMSAGQWRPQKKILGGQDVIIYDVTNQIFECDTDEPTDVTTSEWLVVTLVWTRRPSGLMRSCTRPVWPGMSKLFSAKASFKIYAGRIW